MKPARWTLAIGLLCLVLTPTIHAPDAFAQGTVSPRIRSNQPGETTLPRQVEGQSSGGEVISRDESSPSPSPGNGAASLRGNPARFAPQPPAEPARLDPLPETPPAAGTGFDIERALSPDGLPATMQIMALLTVLSLAPSILMMTTCFIRFVIVMSLLRQALGTQQLPPNQVITSLCLFLTFMVMSPIWKQCYDEGIVPYTNPEPGQSKISLSTAFENTARPLRRFMADQIEKGGNSEAVWMFLDFTKPAEGSEAAKSYQPPESYDEVPLGVLLSSYMMSELKVAFIIGFQIYLPFLVIDMVISTVLISMGMMMLPPVLVSLPFKLLLFILIDGWFLTVGMLLESVRPFS